MLLAILRFISILFSAVAATYYILHLKYDHKDIKCKTTSHYQYLARLYVVLALSNLLFINIIVVITHQTHKDLFNTLQLGILLLPIAIAEVILS